MENLTHMIPDLADVAGHSLAGTTYTISSAENERLCRSVGSEPAKDGTAHPIYFYIATQLGMGTTVADLCKVCNFDVNDGPLLGGCDVEFQDQLAVEVPYLVGGEIVSLTRKTSKKLGVIDLLEYRLTLTHDDHIAMSVTNNWILPRGHES